MDYPLQHFTDIWCNYTKEDTREVLVRNACVHLFIYDIRTSQDDSNLNLKTFDIQTFRFRV